MQVYFGFAGGVPLGYIHISRIARSKDKHVCDLVRYCWVPTLWTIFFFSPAMYGWLFTQSCEQNVLLHLLILPFSWLRNGISVKFSFAFLFSMGELIYFSICLRNTYTQSKSSVHISCPLWGFFSISFKELFIY